MVIRRFDVYLLRVVDKTRLVKRLGRVDKPTQKKVLQRLAEMFAE